jgi:alpha-amylase/alpha-mannosidase (GH57 family)
MERYVCIHCHFYQPPRENPWLEAVELQDSAYPYHDWNERITAECYAPNSASRILDGKGLITGIVNNYAQISFNFGPTLLSWLEEKAPAVYEAILEADRESQGRFSGHGSALAQAYNHMIMPLASRRDQHTQTLWGIRDFEHRFGRFPEGMWLPETAASAETLEVLAELGIKFTVLAPHQAKQVRKIGAAGKFRNVEGGKIDPTRAYLVRLPHGRSINVFFYDGPISRAVAFEGLLSNGEGFANRILSGFSDQRKGPQLMHIATDGETYGHHHRFGDMALAYALHHIESKNLAKLTNYGEYLEKHPPEQEVEIIDNTSWSCVHGVERWRSSCGCNSGGKPGWTQEWRGPLRAALDWLRDELAAAYEENARQLLKDPWGARDAYIDVVRERSPESLVRFFEAHATRSLSEQEVVSALKLLEMQRHLMLMYTSCGWFFDELSGIETVQVIMYAGRALQLAQEEFGDSIEDRFLELLAKAKSNLPELRDGAEIYKKWIKPAAVTLLRLAAHFAISSLFERYEQETSIYSYDVTLQDARNWESGRARLILGHAHISSRITNEKEHASFGVLHFGDHNLSAGVRPFRGDQEYVQLVLEASAAFQRADLPEVLRVMDRHFEGTSYSLKSLFRDEQRKVLGGIMAEILGEVEGSYSQVYEHHAPLMGFLSSIGTPLPKVLQVTSEFVLNSQLRRALTEAEPDLDRIHTLLETMQREKVALDAEGLGYALRQRLEEAAEALAAEPRDAERLQQLDSLVTLGRSLPFEVSLWKVQNVYYELCQRLGTQPEGIPEGLFRQLGENLGIEVGALVEQQAA